MKLLLLVAMAAAVFAVTAPPTHDRAGMAIETKGSNVQSSTQSSDAKLDTSTSRSFQVVSFVGVVYPKGEIVSRDGTVTERGGDDGDDNPVALLLLVVLPKTAPSSVLRLDFGEEYFNLS